MTYSHRIHRLPRRLAAGLTALALTGLGLLAAPAASAAETPAISVYLADGATPYTNQPVHDGDQLVVKGTGFDPTANVGGGGRPIPADLPQGNYVAFGSFTPVWQPSAGAPATARVAGPTGVGTIWVLSDAVLNQLSPEMQGALRPASTALAEDGSFTATVTITALEDTPEGGIWGIYTYAAGGTVNAGQELSVPINYVAGGDEATDDTSAEDEAAAEQAAKDKAAKQKAKEKAAKQKAKEKAAKEKAAKAKAAQIQCTVENVPANIGTPRLSWGVKGTFLGYVDSNLADGAVTADGGAVWNGSTVTWGTGSGNLAANGTGTLTFPGTLHITGHEGVLDLTMSNLTVRSTGGDKGVLSATISSSDMDGNPVSASGELATLAFSSIGQRGGSAAATLTANGAKAFAGFYSAGEALDPLTITFAGSSPAATVKTCVDADGNVVNEDGTPVNGLASTGVKTSQLTAAALVLLLAGFALLAADRRRETAR